VVHLILQDLAQNLIITTLINYLGFFTAGSTFHYPIKVAKFSILAHYQKLSFVFF
jgi:hypothetical protein